MKSPRIAYVINSFDGGGAELGLLALVKGGLFANCSLKIVALVRGNGGLERQLADLGHSPEILLDRTTMRPQDLPRIFLRLWRVISRLKPQIVIASLPQANLLARMCVLLRPQTLFISFEHNTHLAKRIYETGYRWTSRRVDWSFADAQSTLDVAQQRLYRRAPHFQTVVPLVSFDSAANRSRGVARDRPFHVVNAARFTVTKNQSALIEAVGLLRDSGRDVKLTLYGEGPERAACEDLAARLRIAEHVQFPGFKRDWAKEPADLFALVSKHEGLCIVVLEAMHAGIPVMAPLIGGLRDYAAGLVYPLPSVEPRALAQAVAIAMAEGAGSRDRAEKAADMVDRRFGAGAVREVYLETNRLLIIRARQPKRQAI